MKNTKFLVLINDERKEQHILSAKGCTGGAYDYCKYDDRAGCSGAGTKDECDYDIGPISCSGGSYDKCGTDSDYCTGGNPDYCLNKIDI